MSQIVEIVSEPSPAKSLGEYSDTELSTLTFVRIFTQFTSSVIRVPLSGPEEAFEAILAVAGHEVDMHVGDALTDAVVDGDKGSIGC